MLILSILISSILIGLAIIHFHWLFGGTFGFAASLPTKESGERILNPKKIDSAIVGLALAAFGLYYLIKSGLLIFSLPEWLMEYPAWIIPSVFLLRAMGDFKYIGFFKSVKNTAFGKLDTSFFSPLCLLIAVLGLLIKFLNEA